MGNQYLYTRLYLEINANIFDIFSLYSTVHTQASLSEGKCGLKCEYVSNLCKYVKWEFICFLYCNFV